MFCYLYIGAESAPFSQSANNNNKQHRRERERARYAPMSHEQKNARNLRQHEAHQKKFWGIPYLLALHIYYHETWMGQHSIK